MVNQNLDFVFCKGYYSRVTNKLHGRVTRLMVTPLVRSLQDLVGKHQFLTFLDSFRYPLSGEFCMTVDVARVNRIPADWGLEVGSLAEVYRNYSPQRVCQTDIAENYEHKHQVLSVGESREGPDEDDRGHLQIALPHPCRRRSGLFRRASSRPCS